MAAAHLYLHVPFCAAKCPYCDFNSVAGREDEHAAYVEALLAAVGRLPRSPWRTVYLGGGTPTALGARLLARLLAGLRGHLLLADDAEFTCEANPGAADAERFAVLAEHGVNRVSLGVQSTHDHHLRALGRIHSAAEAERALALARARFARVSADLMLGLSGQSDAELDADLALYARHGLDHASVYHLAYEAGTEFRARLDRGELAEIDAGRSQAMLERAWDRLAALGLAQYETSNFARPGQESRHNLAYWQGGEWLAAGAGAVADADGVRTTYEKHPGRWIAAVQEGGDGAWRIERPSAVERRHEAWMLGLRTARGADLARLAALGEREARWRPAAARLAELGLVREDGGFLALSRAGRLVQDSVTVELME